MPPLPTRALGRTGLKVTLLGFGAMELRGPRIWGGRPVTEQQAERILNAVLDAGINFIDTSNDYGRSEEFIGRFISHRRSEYFLATKCGCKLTPAGDRDETSHIWTRDNILRGVEESLARLKTSYVDLLQLHNPTVEAVRENKVVDVLREVRAAGKARFIGISTVLPHLSAFLDMGVFDTFQIPYSCLERTHERLIGDVAKAGAGTIVRGGIARGSFLPERTTAQRELWENARLSDLLDGRDRAEFVLRFTLSHPDVHTTIVGTLDPEHLAANLAALAKGPLPAGVYKEAVRRLEQAGAKPEG